MFGLLLLFVLGGRGLIGFFSSLVQGLLIHTFLGGRF
jgi:hypothetical protein